MVGFKLSLYKSKLDLHITKVVDYDRNPLLPRFVWPVIHHLRILRSSTSLFLEGVLPVTHGTSLGYDWQWRLVGGQIPEPMNFS